MEKKPVFEVTINGPEYLMRLKHHLESRTPYDSPDDISDQVLGDKLNELRKEYNIKPPRLT